MSLVSPSLPLSQGQDHVLPVTMIEMSRDSAPGCAASRLRHRHSCTVMGAPSRTSDGAGHRRRREPCWHLGSDFQIHPPQSGHKGLAGLGPVPTPGPKSPFLDWASGVGACHRVLGWVAPAWPMVLGSSRQWLSAPPGGVAAPRFRDVGRRGPWALSSGLGPSTFVDHPLLALRPSCGQQDLRGAAAGLL